MTGDGGRRDKDGYIWITGRVDDVLNVSGHRIGTAEVESALVLHPAVAEAAVVGVSHEIKGEGEDKQSERLALRLCARCRRTIDTEPLPFTGIYAYVTLMDGVEQSDALRKELVGHVRHQIGPIATPDVIHWAPAVPKTRSGKIMRRILRKIASGGKEVRYLENADQSVVRRSLAWLRGLVSLLLSPSLPPS